VERGRVAVAPLRVTVISWYVERKLAATVVRRSGMTQDVVRVTLINQTALYVSRCVLSCVFYELMADEFSGA